MLYLQKRTVNDLLSKKKKKMDKKAKAKKLPRTRIEHRYTSPN